MTLDTVIGDTFAASAMSLIVARANRVPSRGIALNLQVLVLRSDFVNRAEIKEVLR
jgi:hypothetical protein